MRRRDVSPDPALAGLLARFDAPASATAAERSALQRRIAQRAAPRLANRAGDAPPWWTFAADWARTLIPLGVATALVATTLLLWNARGERHGLTIAPMAAPDSLVGAAGRDVTSQRLLDDLVTPLPAPASSRRHE